MAFSVWVSVSVSEASVFPTETLIKGQKLPFLATSGCFGDHFMGEGEESPERWKCGKMCGVNSYKKPMLQKAGRKKYLWPQKSCLPKSSFPETGNWQKWKLCCRKRDRLQPWTLEVCVCQHLHLHAINQQNMYSANTQTVKFGSKLILTFQWQEMQIHYRNRFDEQWSAQFQKKDSASL